MSYGQPIKPSEIAHRKAQIMPPEVIEAFNHLIAKNWDKSSQQARVTQEEAVIHLMAALELERDEVFKHKYLDVEDVFEASGWKVRFDKPGYYESYGAYFIFSEK